MAFCKLRKQWNLSDGSNRLALGSSEGEQYRRFIYHARQHERSGKRQKSPWGKRTTLTPRFQVRPIVLLQDFFGILVSTRTDVRLVRTPRSGPAVTFAASVARLHAELKRQGIDLQDMRAERHLEITLVATPDIDPDPAGFAARRAGDRAGQRSVGGSRSRNLPARFRRAAHRVSDTSSTARSERCPPFSPRSCRLLPASVRRLSSSAMTTAIAR